MGWKHKKIKKIKSRFSEKDTEEGKQMDKCSGQ